MAKHAQDLEVKNIRLFKGDYERLGNLFPTMGAGPAVRALVRNTIKRAEAAAKPLDIQLDGVEELLNEQ